MNKQAHPYAAYAYCFFAFFGITQLWVIYLGQQGLSLVAIGLCESIFHVASFLFEVPSGVLADRFSYRRILLLSRVAALISAAMMLYNGGMWWFALSFVFSAWSYNLQSGTLEALLYETLVETGAEARWPVVASRLNMIIEVATSSGLILAGTLVHVDLALTYWLALAFALAGMLCAGSLKEPRQRRHPTRPETIITIVRAAWQQLRSRPELRRLMLLDAALSAITAGYYFYFQAYMTAHHFGTARITGLLVATTLSALLAMRFSPRLLRLPPRRLFAAMIAALAALLLLSSTAGPGLTSALFVLIYALSALLPPLFTVLYNTRIASAQRATLLSVASLLYSLAMIGLFPLLGWLVSQCGFGATFAGVGALLLVAGGLTLTRRA